MVFFRLWEKRVFLEGLLHKRNCRWFVYWYKLVVFNKTRGADLFEKLFVLDKEVFPLVLSRWLRSKN